MEEQSKLESELEAAERSHALNRLILGSFATIALLFTLSVLRSYEGVQFLGSSAGYNITPLVMRGGDPYIRALMRTISASEANSTQPYSILYGGQHVYDLSHHPDRCITIVSGPHTGDCTTAAGRYQILSSTWSEKARLYHPNPTQFLFWGGYSFEPEFQDEVVYAWLKDPQAWGADLSTLLQQGRVNEVLKILSSTWTSLGYGIEDNAVTGVVPKVYQKMLREELSTSGVSAAPGS